MKLLYVSLMTLFLLSFHSTFALSDSAKRKYPYQCLTNDYGILNEGDLAFYLEGIKQQPFPAGPDYWQCFPTRNVKIKLDDMGYSCEEIGWEENLGELQIIVTLDGGIRHEYVTRRLWGMSVQKDFAHSWEKIMKEEKYVCISGEFVDRENKVEKGKSVAVSGWIFNRIKTKKGCESYFVGPCNTK